jgi:DNA-binding MarR family transcriptional regulator
MKSTKRLILSHIKEHPGSYTRQISSTLDLKRSNVQRIVAALQAQNLVSMKTDLKDVRKKQIYITEAGELALSKKTVLYTCSKCGKSKQKSEFYQHRTVCKACISLENIEYYQKNKIEINKKAIEKRKKTVNYHRAKDSAASWFIPPSTEGKSPSSSPRSAGVE